MNVRALPGCCFHFHIPLSSCSLAFPTQGGWNGDTITVAIWLLPWKPLRSLSRALRHPFPPLMWRGCRKASLSKAVLGYQQLGAVLRIQVPGLRLNVLENCNLMIYDEKQIKLHHFSNGIEKCLQEHLHVFSRFQIRVWYQMRGSLMGFCLWGHTVGHDWSDLAAAAAAAAKLF